MSEPSQESTQQRDLWRRWVDLEGGAAGRPDELTLAAYAEARLDPAEARAVEAFLAAHPEIAEDVAAARVLGGGGAGEDAVLGGEALAAAIGRASALVPGSGDRIIAF